jgi:sporulation protein yabP
MQNEKPVQHAPHNVILENRKKVSITGVLDVDSFDEQNVVVLCELGVLIIKGEDLHINRLNVESGDVSVEGEINSLSYTQIGDKKAGGVFRNLFK